MTNVSVAFGTLEEGENVQLGSTFLECYLVFDIKMYFTRKTQCIANGSKTLGIMSSTYAGVVSRETVRIAVTYAALHGLDVTAGDIQNAYL